MSKKIALIALALASPLSLVMLSLASASHAPLGPGNLLTNGDFELGTAGWNTLFGATFLTVTSPVTSGAWAASLYKGQVTGRIYIYQDVGVIPGTTYTLTGWLYNDQDAYDEMCLQIEWPGAAWPEWRECLYGEYSFYRPITVGPVDAPSQSSIARIRAFAEIGTADPASPVYFDDLELASSVKPAGYIPLVTSHY